MNELIIMSRMPSERFPDGRHYVLNMWDSELKGTNVTIHAIIAAHCNSFDEAQTIINNIK